MTSQSNSNWSSWAVNTLVKNPLSWSVGRIKESILPPTPTIDEKSEYVILHLIENQANELFNTISVNEQSQILFMDDLQKKLHEMWNVDVSMTSTELIVHSLEIRNKVFVERGEHLVTNKTLVKIASCDKDVEPISELEKNFFKLKETEKILIGEISNMDFEKESLTKEAKSYIAKNMKPIALTYLRKKKEVEKRIEKQLKSLDNVQALISRIEESKYNAEVLQSYAHGLAALKLSSKETGLTIDNVDETMAELAEVIDEHKDMQSAMGSLVDVKQKYNEQELEDELADLLGKDEPTVSNTEKHHIPDLPSVPDNSLEGEELDLDRRLQLLREH
ncbi:charged multivesicular body protein 7 isoform X3 [Rhopalosiphum maidis]|nr:charged multivesicular body protein 7 isoform X3 [Rhopalosiphum maidis]